MAWNSAVSGAPSWPRGLVGSHWLLTPGGRRHWPAQSGYFDSSNACAAPSEKVSAAATASAPKLQRNCITFSPKQNSSVIGGGRYFRDGRKYFKSGGAWSFLAGIRKPSALSM